MVQAYDFHTNQPLGSGAYGVVWLAKHKRTGGILFKRFGTHIFDTNAQMAASHSEIDYTERKEAKGRFEHEVCASFLQDVRFVRLRTCTDDI